MINRLKPAQAIQFLREAERLLDIKPGTTLIRVDIVIPANGGPEVCISTDEPIMDAPPVRAEIIERAETA